MMQNILLEYEAVELEERLRKGFPGVKILLSDSPCSVYTPATKKMKYQLRVSVKNVEQFSSILTTLNFPNTSIKLIENKMGGSKILDLDLDI